MAILNIFSFFGEDVRRAVI